eukprot:4621069-Pleurochrysis_carterae.AAC.1
MQRPSGSVSAPAGVSTLRDADFHLCGCECARVTIALTQFVREHRQAGAQAIHVRRRLPLHACARCPYLALFTAAVAGRFSFQELHRQCMRGVPCEA